jgi:hypothetical protein
MSALVYRSECDMNDAPRSNLHTRSRLLRSLAAMLSDVPGEKIAAVSVGLSGPFEPGDALTVVDVARRTAGEYGVRASSHMVGHTLTIRFDRVRS